MSGRALLAIGCDAYNHMSPLRGAEADAAQLHSMLMQPAVGDYDVSRSRLLRSPSLAQVREALLTMLFDGERLDTFTIVFAGHGAVSGGSYYMAACDSRAEALSVTALPLADLFRMIAEAAPKQSYLFIDACQSGGLISDLNVILKSEVMGELGTPGVTLLATAASNEDALEIDGQGVGTGALLGCIRGEIFLQDNSPALDLVEIGRAVSERISAAGGQTPVVWGLNLYGPSSFCKNPHAGTGDTPLRSVLAGWPDPASAATIRASLPRLWEPYVTLASKWNARNFLNRLAPILEALGPDPAILLDFIDRVSGTFAIQARGSRDRFREIEVEATCAVALLPFSDVPTVANRLTARCTRIANLTEAAIRDVIASVDNYRFSLVTGGLGDLYALPIRVLKLLGWAGFALHTRDRTGVDVEGMAKVFAHLFDRIERTYSLSLVAMSDMQAPYLLTAATAAVRADLLSEGERLLGHMFASLVDCGGRVAQVNLPTTDILSYLIKRSNHDLKSPSMVAQPSELAIVLLRLSQLFDLTDEFDGSLEALDHLALNAYLPNDYRQFGAEHISSGTNAVFHIGHDIWSVAELEAAWPNFPMPAHPGTALTALLASLIFPDRSPWFLLPVPSLIEGTSEAVP